MIKKEIFNQQKLLDQMGICISKDNFKESMEILHELCIHNPFRTQIFVQLYIHGWSGKLLNMIDAKSFKDSGSRIRSLYMLVVYNRAFNKLITIYFDNLIKENYNQSLKDYDRAVNLSMKSQYFFQKGHHTEAEKNVEECFNELEKLFKDKKKFTDGWLLIRKCLKNVKNKEKANYFLEKILEKIDK